MRRDPKSVIAVSVTALWLTAEVGLASDDDLKALLDGVKVVDAPGLPGPVCAFGEEAFAVVVGCVKRAGQLPLVVASRFGKGRVVAFGKDGFFSPKTLDIGDTGRLVANAARWAAGRSGPVTVGVHLRKGLAPALQKHGLDARDVTLDQLDAVDVVIARPNRVDRAGIEKLSQFVAKGKGLLAGELGWGWLQLNRGKTLTHDFGANQLLAPMGIVWADGMLDRTTKSGYAAGETPSPLTNASKALDAALAHAAGKTKLSKEDLAQVSTVLTRTAQVLPSTDKILLPRIRELTADNSINVVPTRKKPVTAGDLLSRLVLTMQIRKAKQASPEEAEAHPAAATFPGVAPNGAARVARTVEINTAIPRWHSTGLYAAPGELVTVTVPESALGGKLKIRIGSTTCRNWRHSRWYRAPEVHRELSIKSTRTEAANAFGGLIYIVVPNDCKLGQIAVTIEGALEAPYFQLGKTDLAEWRDKIRHLPAPRAEIASKKAILTVPSKDVRGLDDPASLMELWNHILDTCADLAAWPSHDRKFPQRYCADAQLCAGYMHAGHPIMLPTSAAPKLVDREHLLKEGNWGLYHETGHNHQHRDWTFGGTGEVTVNLFTLYILDKVCGIKPSEGRMTKGKIQQQVSQHFAKSCPFSEWKRKPFLALYMYYQMQQAFGWDVFTRVFAEYRDLPATERPKSDDGKRDQWLVRFSRTAGRNLGPFFEAWGVPTSEKARASIRDLPVWMPEDLPTKTPKKS